MSTAHAAPSNSLVLHGIDWRTYARLLRLFDERRSIRLTYDRGNLEITTLSPEHENLNLLLNHLVVAAAEELGLEIASYGSMTMRRRGLEADQCYWIANEARMRGRDRIDLRTDPPPDLVIEVDVSRSSMDRMTIYAALGVPEFCGWTRKGSASSSSARMASTLLAQTVSPFRWSLSAPWPASWLCAGRRARMPWSGNFATGFASNWPAELLRSPLPERRTF